ncbi:MAG: hypothetical protein FWD33_01590 [Alphaproteobacteria bacterium]|nr:hypothetical protein [Alphaproteobacteria bacterium]
MNKIIAASAIVLATATAANAMTVFDPTFRTKAGKFNTIVDISYASGDFLATDGNFRLGTDDLTYGITDNFNVFIQEGRTRPAVGVNWQMVNDKKFGLDLIATADLNKEDLSAAVGVSAYGTISKDWQWGVSGMFRYTSFDDFDDSVELRTSLMAQAMYKIDSKWSLLGQFNYQIDRESEDGLSLGDKAWWIYSKNLTFGVVYAWKPNVAVMPYITSELDTNVYYDGSKIASIDGGWIVGARFGIQF